MALFNPHRKLSDLIPIWLKLWWRNLTNATTTQPQKKSSTNVYESPGKAAVVLQAVLRKGQAQQQQDDYNVEGKTVYHVTMLDDDEVHSRFLSAANHPIDSKSAILVRNTQGAITNTTTPISISVHDHSMTSTQTGKIVSIAEFSKQFATIPNDESTVVAFNCNAGKGRSVVATAIWLMQRNDMTLLAAMRQITTNRSVAETIPGVNPGRNHKLLAAEQQGYLGYAFVNKLAGDIQASDGSVKEHSTFDNFLREELSIIDKNGPSANLLNSFRPLFSLPLGNMEPKDRVTLYANFRAVRNKLIAEMSAYYPDTPAEQHDILALLSNPHLQPPLSALELSNLAILEHEASADQTLETSAKYHALDALLSFCHSTNKTDKYFSAQQLITLLSVFPLDVLFTDLKIHRTIQQQIRLNIEKYLMREFNRIPYDSDNVALKCELAIQYKGVQTVLGEDLGLKLAQEIEKSGFIRNNELLSKRSRIALASLRTTFPKSKPAASVFHEHEQKPCKVKHAPTPPPSWATEATHQTTQPPTTNPAD